MALEYEIKDSENSFRLNLNSYTLVEVMYSAERCTTPMPKERAEELINKIKNLFELEFPVETLNEEEYEPSEFGKFLESLCDDDDGCDGDLGRDLMKLMMLKAMMD